MSNYYKQIKKTVQNSKQQVSESIDKGKDDLFNYAKKIAEKQFSKNMINATKKYHKQYGFDSKEGEHEFSTHNNEADAFKHTYMQALIALRSGEDTARYLGDMHENDGAVRNQPSGEENMDLWNNNQGREIADEIKKNYSMNFWTEKAEDIIAEKVMERMRAGKLITNPNDKRHYVSKYSDKPKLNAVSITKNIVSAAVPKSASQKFSDLIRQKFNSKINENNKKLNFNFSKSSNSTSSGKGQWITVNGRHVFIEK